MISVAIIDYGSGNLRSVEKAFEHAAGKCGIKAKIQVTDDPKIVLSASHVVLPGVGAFGDCAAGLKALPGMWPAIERAVSEQGKAFLGICVGMQLMADRGLEHGVHDGFGWIAGEVLAITPEDRSLKIPHMGWNEIEILSPHPVLDDLGARHAYFVHSYHLRAEDASHVLARTDYGGAVSAVVGRDNMIGTQFHPEKSQNLGLSLIGNFLQWNG